MEEKKSARTLTGRSTARSEHGGEANDALATVRSSVWGTAREMERRKEEGNGDKDSARASARGSARTTGRSSARGDQESEVAATGRSFTTAGMSTGRAEATLAALEAERCSLEKRLRDVDNELKAEEQRALDAKKHHHVKRSVYAKYN